MKVLKQALETLTVDLPKFFTDLDRISEKADNIARVKPNNTCKEGENNGKNITRRTQETVQA